MSGSRANGTNPRAMGKSLRQQGLSKRQLEGRPVKAKRKRYKHAPRDIGVTRKVRFEIMKRDGFRCTYCGASGLNVELHVDHVLAVANGGSSEAGNLVTACRDCNLGKGSTPLCEVVL